MLRFKLHAKFLLLVLGSLVVFLGIVSSIIVQREARLLADKADEKQHLLAFTIFSDLKTNMMKGTPRSTLELLDNLRSMKGLARVSVLTQDGFPAFGLPGGRLSLPRFEDVALRGEEVSYTEPGPIPLHTILFPLKNEPDCRACHSNDDRVLGVLLISLSREDALQEIQTGSRHLALILGVLILIIGGVLYLVIRMVVLKPLATLYEGAERIGRGDLAHRIEMSTRDELQDLAKAFNVMAGSLEESYGGLEHKIRERTVQLHATMREVQDKANRLYSHSRAMATISRLSTTVFNAKLTLDELLDRFMWGITRGLGYRRTMLCLVDRKRVWLEVKRDTGIGDILDFKGQSLLSDEALITLARSGKIQVLDARIAAPGPQAGHAEAEDRPHHLFIIPLLNRLHSKTCWQITSCIKTDCPAYHDQDTPCWLMENTLCGNPLFETRGNKLASCMTCNVFPVIGALIVDSNELSVPSQRRQVSVLRILAAEMAAALENHRLHEENQQMVKELLELHRVTAAALSDLSLDNALEVFTDSALKFSGLDACTFWLTSPDGRSLVRKAGGCVDNNERMDLCPDRLPIDEGLIGRALRQQNNFVIDYNVEANDTTPLRVISTTYGLRSLLAIGLKSEGGPIGVFSAHKRNTMPFLETEIAAFMLLANQAAMAIDVCVLNGELKNQNRELARHTNLLSGILANMSSGVMLLDTNGTVMLVNLVGASILRSRREDLMKRKLTDLYPETAAFIKQMSGPQQIEIPLPGGATLPIGFSSAFYNGVAGEYDGVIVVYQDLSEIKALQSELLNKERFAAMGRVVSGVAHEIRNPLFGISSVGQILEREMENPAHRELIRALLAETRRMNQLVEELLLYGRPMKLRLEQCDVSAVWNEVFDMHQEELARREISFKGDFSIGAVPTYLDVNQIRQVFLNLLRNAMDATLPGGSITFRFLLEENSFTFKLTDTGSGIPAANMDKIFDLFFTTKPKGTGLGLAICRKIVQDHGGDISAESREWDWLDEKRGTTITVKLPYHGVMHPEATTP